MSSHVFDIKAFIRESFITGGAGERLVTGVNSYMLG
jgi:hypothetical protein